MIGKARMLRAASVEELGWFSATSVLIVLLIAFVGVDAGETVPELIGSEPSFSADYIADGLRVMGDAALLGVPCVMAFKNHRLLQDTVARVELAEDEMAWVKRSSQYERMVEDRELMRLTANVRRVCRSYAARHILFAEFLDRYRALINRYGTASKERRSSLIEQMNEAAEERLEQYETRRQRERRQKEKEQG